MAVTQLICSKNIDAGYELTAFNLRFVRLVSPPQSFKAAAMSDSPSSPPGRQPNPSSPPPNRNPHPHLDLSTLTFSPLTGASPSQTPTLHETYLSLKRNLSVKSLKELELREVSAALWRKGGKVGPEEEESELVIEQPEVEHETGEKEVVKRKSTGRLSHGRREPMPTDAEQLVVHALRGGVRELVCLQLGRSLS